MRFVVIDSPPQLSLLTVNILQAATELLIPIDPGLFAVAGIGRLQETIDQARRNLEHPELGIVGVLITRANRNKLTTDLEQQLRDAYGALVFKTRHSDWGGCRGSPRVVQDDSRMVAGLATRQGIRGTHHGGHETWEHQEGCSQTS